MTSFIKQNYKLDLSHKKQSNDQQADTENLKLKMKLLQEQIQTLKTLKHRKIQNHDQAIIKSRQVSNITTPQYDSIPVQPLQLTNIKSDKVTSLVTQIHVKNSARTSSKRHLSLSSQDYSLPTQRQTTNSIKQTLQKIDISSGRNKKKAGVNVYQLKGVKHNVDSNIFNVTIAQIMTEEHEKYQMVKEIKRLKDKLKDLELKKIQNQQKIKLQSEQQQQQERSMIQTHERRRIVSNIDFPNQSSTARHTETLTAGRIYSRSRVLMNYHNHQDDSQLANSRITDGPFQTYRHSIQLRKNSNPFTWNPEVSLTQKPGQIRTHRTINHRVSHSINSKKPSMEFSSEQILTTRNKPFFNLGKKRQIVKQIQKQSDVSQQQSEQPQEQLPKEEPKKAIELLPELKMDKMRKNQQIPNDFLPNFRQYIKQKLLSITLPTQPTQYQTQSDLQSMGNILFSLFDIYVQEQVKKKDHQYKVTKYKNCVLYRLNDEKNIVWYYDGRFYFGGWEINLIGEGKKEGFGLEILPNNYTYQGYFLNNKRDGYGIMFNQYKAEQNKNVIYEGEWKQGLKHGTGYQAQTDLQYLGDFQAGIQTGHCKIKTQNTFYEGEIKQSIKEGKGYQILKNGDQYNGQFAQNMFHGLGQYKWKSCAYFYGSFVKGIRKGQGIWISNINSENFDIYQGSYDQNKKNGYGVYQWANGTAYEGYFKNDLRHDEGLMKYPNGKAAKFMWKDGNKANKIYSKQQEQYRCNRNSAIKISPQPEQDTDENQPKTQNFQNIFRNDILNSLNRNPELKLFHRYK